LRCIATRKEGITEIVAGLERHRAWLAGTENGRARRKARLSDEVREGLREALIEAATNALGDRIEVAVREVDAREKDPYTATEELVAEFKRR
jgi:putative protein kinase ArgK-like GTPase of G3E family